MWLLSIPFARTVACVFLDYPRNCPGLAGAAVPETTLPYIKVTVSNIADSLGIAFRNWLRQLNFNTTREMLVVPGIVSLKFNLGLSYAK